jgi:hypothetical protein
MCPRKDPLSLNATSEDGFNTNEIINAEYL